MSAAEKKRERFDDKGEAFKNTLAILQKLPKEDRDNCIRALAIFFEVAMPDDAASVAFWSRRG